MFFDIKEYVEKNPKTNKCDIYIFNGPRRLGKTYSGKNLMCETKENFNYNSVWLRRFSTQLTQKSGSFFNKYTRENWKQTSTREIGYENKTGIYQIALTESENIKGIYFPSVKYFVFDEYQTKGIYFKGSNEPTLLNDIVFTMTDYNSEIDQKVILLSNSVDSNNPYLIYYGVKKIPPPGKYFIFYHEVEPGVRLKVFIMNIQMSGELKEKAKTSLAYKMASVNQQYFNYAINNEYSFSRNELIDNNLKKLYHLHNVVINNVKYGVWKCMNEKILFCHETPNNRTYALDGESAVMYNLNVINLDTLIYLYRNKLMYNKLYFSDYLIRKDVIGWLKKQP